MRLIRFTATLSSLAFISSLLCLSPRTSRADLGIGESRTYESGFGLGRGRNPFVLSVSAGAGQVNPNVARSVPDALQFNVSAGMLEVAIGPADSQRVNLDYLKATFFSTNRLQGSFNWFGLSSVKHYGDVDGFSATRPFAGGIEFLPLNTQFHTQTERGYFIFRPTLAWQRQLFAIRIAPMAGRGYGQLPSGARSNVGFAGFNVGFDGKLSSGWLTGRSSVRIQAGASIDLYQDLTGHLGQIAVAGKINDDTMTGLAYCELVLKPGKVDEWALGWKASYDRLAPYDPETKNAARNEDTAIAFYLRWSGGANVGSPVAGATF